MIIFEKTAKILNFLENSKKTDGFLQDTPIFFDILTKIPRSPKGMSCRIAQRKKRREKVKLRGAK